RDVGIGVVGRPEPVHVLGAAPQRMAAGEADPELAPVRAAQAEEERVIAARHQTLADPDPESHAADRLSGCRVAGHLGLPGPGRSARKARLRHQRGARGRLVTRVTCSTIQRMSAARFALLLLAMTWLALAGAPARAGECDPWPGEPRPLPRVGEGDRLLMRWAELRAEELAQQAEALEASVPIEANRVWRHVLCLAPGHEPARIGEERTQPLRVH